MQLTKKMYIFAVPVNNWNEKELCFKGDVEIFLWLYETYQGGECLGSVDVTFEVAHKPDPLKLKLQELESKKKDLGADFNARVTEIQRQINELTAIEV